MGKKWVLLLPFLLIISGCTTIMTSPIEAPLNEAQSWPQRQKQLQLIDQWNISGRMAARSPQKSGSADFQWDQYRPPQNYHITVFGVLGVSMIEIISHPGNVELIKSSSEHYAAVNATDLVYQNTGWHIPIYALYYWVRALPVPDSEANIDFDHYNHPITIKQFGWTVTYLKYGSVNKRIDLPTLIKITNSDDSLSLKLFINHWNIY